MAYLPLCRFARADGVQYIYLGENGYELRSVYNENDASYMGAVVDSTSYQATERDLFLIANNAEITGASTDAKLMLLGNSSATVPGAVITATNSYALEMISVAAIADLMNEHSDDIIDAYSYLITGNYTFEYPTCASSIDVDNGGCLTVSYAGEEGGHTTLFVNSLTIRTGGALVITANGNNPNGIQIFDGGSLTIEEIDSVTAADGSCLEIGENVTSNPEISAGEYVFVNNQPVPFEHGGENPDYVDEGLQFFFREDRMNVYYTLAGSIEEKQVNDHDFINAADLENIDSVTVRYEPKDDLTLDSINVDICTRVDDDPNNDVWTQLEEKTGTFTLTKGNGWARKTDVEFHFPGENASEDGIQFFFDGGRMNLFYALDNSDPASVRPDEGIRLEDLENVSSVLVSMNLFDGLTVDDLEIHVIAHPEEGDDYEINVTVENNSFVISKGNSWPKKIDVDIRTNDGPGPVVTDGLVFMYNPDHITNATYTIDNEEPAPAGLDTVVDLSSLNENSTVTFLFTPIDGLMLSAISAEVRFYYEGMNDPVTEQIMITSNSFSFTMPQDGWGRKVEVNVITPGDEEDRINLDFDDNRVTVEYSLDEGTNWQAVGQEKWISKETLGNATSIDFRLVDFDEGYSFNKAEYTCYYDLQNQTQTLTATTNPFTITKNGDKWGRVEVRFFLDEPQGPQPQDGNFIIETAISGKGSVLVGPGEFINNARFDGEAGISEYEINCDYWNYISVGFSPLSEEGYQIGSVKVNGEEVQLTNNAFTLFGKPDSQARIRIDVEFLVPDDVKLQDIFEHGYAYTVSTSASESETISKLTDCFIDETWCWYFNTKTDEANSRDAKYPGIYTHKETYRNSVSVPTMINAADDAVNLPYGVFTIYIGELSRDIKVYVMNKPGFIVETPSKNDPDVHEYTIVDTSAYENGRGMDITLKYDHDVGYPPVFGNGVDVNGAIMSDSNDVFSAHINQMHSGEVSELFDDDLNHPENFVNVRLIIVMVPDDSVSAVKAQGDQICAGWDFANLNVYTANTDLSEATHAYIYIGAEVVWISNVQYSNTDDEPTITGIALDESTGLVEENLIDISGPDGNGTFAIRFLSNYDLIPLILTFSDGTRRYLYLHRVGARVNEQDIPTDQSYTRGIFATYYYPTGDSQPSSDDLVDLFVTITKKNGDIETRFISGASPQLIDSGDGPNNTSWNRWCAKFELWSGEGAEYAQIDKVEVIVFKAGDNTNFGGVVVGSGRGVIWEKES
jgi:hypothetical protein